MGIQPTTRQKSLSLEELSYHPFYSVRVFSLDGMSVALGLSSQIATSLSFHPYKHSVISRNDSSNLQRPKITVTA